MIMLLCNCGDSNNFPHRTVKNFEHQNLQQLFSSKKKVKQHQTLRNSTHNVSHLITFKTLNSLYYQLVKRLLRYDVRCSQDVLFENVQSSKSNSPHIVNERYICFKSYVKREQYICLIIFILYFIIFIASFI